MERALAEGIQRLGTVKKEKQARNEHFKIVMVKLTLSVYFFLMFILG